MSSINTDKVRDANRTNSFIETDHRKRTQIPGVLWLVRKFLAPVEEENRTIALPSCNLG